MPGAGPYMHSRMQVALPRISEWQLNSDTEIANIFKISVWVHCHFKQSLNLTKLTYSNYD